MRKQPATNKEESPYLATEYFIMHLQMEIFNYTFGYTNPTDNKNRAILWGHNAWNIFILEVILQEIFSKLKKAVKQEKESKDFIVKLIRTK